MGAKIISPSVPYTTARFNPRTRDGCENDTAITELHKIVSIHAPVMGAN